MACGKGHVSVAAGGVRGTLVGPMEAGAPHLRSGASRHSRPSAPAHRMQLPGPPVELRAVKMNSAHPTKTDKFSPGT